MIKKVSIVIPCRNEEKYIVDCVRSLLTNGYDPALLEILVVDGKSTDRTAELVEQLNKEYTQVRLLVNEKKVTPNALNIGIHNATGNYILIASAHSAFSKGYIATLVEEIEKLENAVAVGGVMKTEVKNETPVSLAIKEVLSNKFGVGNAMFRIGIEKVTKVDTVPFGLYRAEKLKEINGYDERLIRNHDIEMSKRLLAQGGNIYLIPNAVCTYFAREKYSKLSQNNYNNGKWNILTVFITKNFKSLSIRHFVPLIFVFSLILPLLASLLFFPLIWLSLASLSAYLIGVAYFSFKAQVKGTTLLHLVMAFFLLHFSYGIGSLIGLLLIPKFAVK
jgi:glycosyltransferase involved in cell wall biosynthesis